MEESRYIKMIENNPSIISTIENPTDEMKLLELRKDVLNTTLSLLGKSDEKEPSFFVLGRIWL